jgi:adenylate cyclase
VDLNLEDLARAGVYDPAAPNASERRALLEWLAGLGVTPEQMMLAHDGGWLKALAGIVALRPGRRCTLAEVASRIGMPAEQVAEYYHAFGMPPASYDDPVLAEEEIAMFAGVAVSARLSGPREMHRFLHLVSTAVASICEAAVSGTIVRTEGRGELVEAQASLEAVQTIPQLEGILTLCLRLQLELAGRRLRHARSSAESNAFRFTVGFVDLVGFTTLSRQMSSGELEGLVDRFESTAYDVAGVRGGRIVKFIGDEVMFVSEEPSVACDIALALIEQFAGDPHVRPRAGLAYGDLLVRSGDYCGPVVNLASRLAELAVRGEVLVTPEVARISERHALRFDPAGRRAVRGFDDPISVLTVERSASR